MNREITGKLIHSQEGFVLVISLLILVVVTMLGVTGLSSATLEGRMAHNMQHSMYAFQAAESVIEDTIRSGERKDTNYTEANDLFLLAFNSGASVTINPPVADLAVYAQAITGNGGAVISTPGSTVTRTGIAGKSCPNFSVGTFVCIPFAISAAATVSTSNASANNIQGVDHLIPGG